MKKIIVVATVAIAMLAVSCEVPYTSCKREVLMDFIHYCQKNDGLEQHTIRPGINSSDSLLRKVARYYAEQDEFADVTDYPRMGDVDALIR